MGYICSSSGYIRHFERGNLFLWLPTRNLRSPVPFLIRCLEDRSLTTEISEFEMTKPEILGFPSWVLLSLLVELSFSDIFFSRLTSSSHSRAGGYSCVRLHHNSYHIHSHSSQDLVQRVSLGFSWVCEVLLSIRIFLAIVSSTRRTISSSISYSSMAPCQLSSSQVQSIRTITPGILMLVHRGCSASLSSCSIHM